MKDFYLEKLFYKNLLKEHMIYVTSNKLKIARKHFILEVLKANCISDLCSTNTFEYQILGLPDITENHRVGQISNILYNNNSKLHIK